MNNTLNSYSADNLASGFTLLEVMIALLIFSVGLLGLAGLQASSLQNNKTADMRSVAIIAAHDMAERIRANQRGKTNVYWNVSAAPTKYINCVTGSCTTADDVANWDIYEWETSLANQLPSGQGSISRANTTSPYVIRVFWDDNHSGANLTDCKTGANELKCYEMYFLP